MMFIDVYQYDSGKLVVLPMDSTLRVALEENPSTGYRWQVEDMSGSCLEQISREFFASSGQIMGAPGIVVFYFKPVKSERCTLYLKLWRPWEKDKSVARRFRLVVSVIDE